MTIATSASAAPIPRYIRMHDNDNVAIVVNDGGLPAGAAFADGLVLREAVPQALPAMHRQPALCPKQYRQPLRT